MDRYQQTWPHREHATLDKSWVLHMKFSHPRKYCHIIAVPMSWVLRFSVFKPCPAIPCMHLHPSMPSGLLLCPYSLSLSLSLSHPVPLLVLDTVLMTRMRGQNQTQNHWQDHSTHQTPGPRSLSWISGTACEAEWCA